MEDAGSVRFAILTVSDSCAKGEAKDGSGENLEFLVAQKILFDGIVIARKCIADEKSIIKEVLQSWCDDGNIDVIFTTGGTGLSKRDVTPEATKSIIEKEAPGFVIAMIQKSLEITPMAMLSRPACGIRGGTLIINLPGSKKAAEECVRFVAPAIKHAVDLLRENTDAVGKVHSKVQVESRATCHHHIHTADHVPLAYEGLPPVAHRSRVSHFPAISVAEAQNIVMNESSLTATEMISFSDGLGRVLAEDIFAVDPLPPFPASIKDGYAVIASDGVGVRTVLGESTAGSELDSVKIISGQCLRINTGAPVPSTADAIVQVEDTKLIKSTEDGQTELEIEICVASFPGKDIRPIGSDIAAGEKVLRKEVVLGPSDLGMLAAVGAVMIKVRKLPSVGVLSTGNELMTPEVKLLPGKIRDSNKTTLMSLLKENGFPSHDLGIALDNPKSMIDKLSQSFEIVDVLVCTGSVSMGDRDMLKPVLLSHFSASVHFGRVYMKPGLPTTFATVEYNGSKKLIFGLPGNPVSATVTSCLFLLPALRKMVDCDQTNLTSIDVHVMMDIELDPRPEYHRVVVTWNREKSLFEARSTGRQISSKLSSLSSANGLLVLPSRNEERKRILQGEKIECLLLGKL